jgi:diguanylate cyclase (GGDEF)-like protein
MIKRTAATVAISVVALVAPVILMVSPTFAPAIAEAGWFAALPFVLMGVSCVLAICFRQTRISALALVWFGFTARGVQHFGGALPERAVGDFVLVVLTLLPVLSLCLFLMEERRMLSARGIVRFYVALVVLGIFYWLPGLNGFHSRVLSLPTWLVGRYDAGGFNLAPLSACLFVGVGCVLLWKERPEAPALGRMLIALLVVGVAAGNAAMGCWPEVGSLAVFRSLCLSAGGVLVWAVLDGAWRHAYVDELTQLPGRRPMRQHFASLGGEYALAVVDIDHFKKVNDRYGHDVGDQVLRFVAGSVRSVKGGTAYRFGGEEFVVVFGRRWTEESQALAETLRKQIAERPFTLRDVSRPERKPRKQAVVTRRKEATIKVTVSIGIAWPTDDLPDPDEVLGLADKALYRAKRGGRNKVCAAGRK